MWATLHCGEGNVQGSVSGIRTSGSRWSSSMGLSSLLPFQWSLCTCVCYYGPLHISLEGGKIQQQTKQLQSEKYGRSRAVAAGLLRNGVRHKASWPHRQLAPQPQLPSLDKGESGPQNTAQNPLVLYLQPQSGSLSFVLYTIFRSKTPFGTFFSNVPTLQSRMQPVMGFKRDQSGR